jgi:CubicO group peptidase (beta-lactamase class C family)
MNRWLPNIPTLHPKHCYITATFLALRQGHTTKELHRKNQSASTSGALPTSMSMRRLLTHASGLSGRTATDALFREDTAADALERQVRALATVEPTQPVGSTYQYANVNYSILGVIMETISGQSYEVYVREQIFAPLQMEQSFPSPVEARSAGLAEGHQYWFGQLRPTQLPYQCGLLPAGFLVLSAEDMSRYLLAHLNGGRVGEAQIISPEGAMSAVRVAREVFKK